MNPTADPRVRAAFVMAPFAVAFAPDAFRGVTAPCPPAFAQELATICKDPPGVDRAAVHRELASDAIAFFDASL